MPFYFFLYLMSFHAKSVAVPTITPHFTDSCVYVTGPATGKGITGPVISYVC